jgi:hypothetical protein
MCMRCGVTVITARTLVGLVKEIGAKYGRTRTFSILIVPAFIWGCSCLGYSAVRVCLASVLIVGDNVLPY